MYEGNNSIQDLGMPYGNSKEFSFSKHESPPDYSARKSGEVNTDENETSLKTLKNKLRLLETSLEEQRAAAKHLREERDEGLTMNGLLKREVEELRRGVYEGKNRSSAHLKSRKYTRGNSSCFVKKSYLTFFTYCLSFPLRHLHQFLV